MNLCVEICKKKKRKENKPFRRDNYHNGLSFMNNVCLLLYGGALLLINISLTSVSIRAWINNYIHIKQRDVIIDPYPNFNGGVVKPSIKLWPG